MVYAITVNRCFMKKIVSVFLMILVFCVTLCGCKSDKNGNRLKIVTTYFAAFDWTRNILGEKYKDTELILISDNGVDIHSYQPTADDIINIKTADIVITIGGSSDKWVTEALKKEKNKNVKVINSLSLLKDRLLCIGDSHKHEAHEHHESDIDEHIWLSLKNAELMCEAINQALKEKDSENTKLYRDNAKAYIDNLNALDNNYSQKFSTAKIKTLIFADRFPFRYTITDYSLEYSALFEGCTTESDATVDAVLSLSKKVDQLSAKYIFIIDNTATKTAKSVIANTKHKNAEILKLNSMQTTIKKDLEKSDYLKIMQNNLSLISKAIC